jgi:hypothetical protein
LHPRHLRRVCLHLIKTTKITKNNQQIKQNEFNKETKNNKFNQTQTPSSKNKHKHAGKKEVATGTCTGIGFLEGFELKRGLHLALGLALPFTGLPNLLLLLLLL